MAFKTSSLLFASCSFAFCSLHASTPENPEQEYQEVRKIALRDPKVRQAYEDADRKLEEKILKLDPALTDYVHHRGSEPVSTPEVKKPFLHAKPKAVVTHTAAPAASGTPYVVQSGDTLGAIAGRFSVSVAALKSANHIVDEKKLAVGQKLVIPHP